LLDYVDMLDEIIIVFTAKSVERILKEGGTSAWRLGPARASRCGYAICTRNAHATWSEGSEPHHSAFLAGRIKDIVPCEPTTENSKAGINRYLIRFSEYAHVDIPKVWKGLQNPVSYPTLEELGLDPATLKWERMPESRR